MQGMPTNAVQRDHRMRFMNNNITMEAARNPYAYVKGTDFNS